MQLAVSFDACVPLAPQHDFPPAKDEVAANTPAANKAKVVLIMHLRQHELRNVQWAIILSEVEGSRCVSFKEPSTGSLDFRDDDYAVLNSIAPFFASARMVCPSPNFPSRMFMLNGSSR